MPLKRSALLYQGLFLLLASYGVLYFSYKYYLPWFGGDDFAEYYKMYLAPLDSRQAQAPFVYRQLGALITSLIHKAGLYYPSRIAFVDPAYDQRVFFAALFSNYLALLASAVSVCMTLNRLTQGRLLFAPLMGGLLCFLSFYSQQAVVTGLAEGWAWFLVAVIFHAYVARHWAVVPLLCLSILQRETIPLAFLLLAALDLLGHRKTGSPPRFLVMTMAASALAFLAYLALRGWWLPVSGNENQMSPSTFLARLMASFPLSKELIFQGLLAQNTYFILLASVAFGAWVNRGGAPEPGRPWASGVLQASAILIVLQGLGLATGIGNSIGRIGAVVTPILSVYAILQLVRLEQALTPARARP